MSRLHVIWKKIVYAPYYLRDLFVKWKRDVDMVELKKRATIGQKFNELSYDRLAGQHCRIYNCNNRDSIVIGDNVCLNGSLFCNRNGSISIGDYSVINHDTFINADISVVIGKYCVIARDVLIQDNNSHPIDPERRKHQSLHRYYQATDTYESEHASIEISDCVWIGTRAIILKGVSIGYGSIVAAGAVVTKSMPPLSIVAGNPAKVVKTIDARER